MYLKKFLLIVILIELLFNQTIFLSTSEAKIQDLANTSGKLKGFEECDHITLTYYICDKHADGSEGCGIIGGRLCLASHDYRHLYSYQLVIDSEENVIGSLYDYAFIRKIEEFEKYHKVYEIERIDMWYNDHYNKWVVYTHTKHIKKDGKWVYIDLKNK